MLNARISPIDFSMGHSNFKGITLAFPIVNKKVKVNFKVHDVIILGKNNYNTLIIQYLTKQRQSENEIWLVNKI